MHKIDTKLSGEIVIEHKQIAAHSQWFMEPYTAA